MKRTHEQKILAVLTRVPLTTGEIAWAINESSSTTSVALQRMARAGKIRCNRKRVKRDAGRGRGGFTWNAK